MSTKVINALSARIAKLETLLENKDAFGSGGGQSFGGLNYQGSQYGGINFGDSYFAAPEFPPWERQDQQMGYDYPMMMEQMEAERFELDNRIQSLELLVSGGSNDTRQSQAVDATQQVGDDGSSGSGATAAPEGSAVAFFGSASLGSVPLNVTTPFPLVASVDSHDAWSGTGYSVASDGYYLCVGDVHRVYAGANPVVFVFSLTQSGGASLTHSVEVETVTAFDSMNATWSAVFRCQRGDVLTMTYLAPAVGSPSIYSAGLSIVKVSCL